MSMVDMEVAHTSKLNVLQKFYLEINITSNIWLKTDKYFISGNYNIRSSAEFHVKVFAAIK